MKRHGLKHAPIDRDKRSEAQVTKDPFSLLRANVSLEDPENSHFLHPVLRYYHSAFPHGMRDDDDDDHDGDGGGDAKEIGDGDHPQAAPAPEPAIQPVAVCHVIEDFHTRWTSHLAHTMPVTRFLQQIGAARARAAKFAAVRLSTTPTQELDEAAAAATDAEPRPIGAQLDYLRQLWKRYGSHYDGHASLVRYLMTVINGASLYVQGKGVGTGEGWFNELSIETEQLIRCTGPRILVIHWYDPHPVPLTDAEVRHLDELRQRDQAGSATPLATASRREVSPRPPLTPGQQQHLAATKDWMATFYSNFTRSVDGAVVISVPVRAGQERIEAERLGVSTIPSWRVHDAYRGVLVLPGDDFDDAPVQLEHLVRWHARAAEAFERGSNHLLFPGYSRRDIVDGLLQHGMARF